MTPGPWRSDSVNTWWNVIGAIVLTAVAVVHRKDGSVFVIIMAMFAGIYWSDFLRSLPLFPRNRKGDSRSIDPPSI